MQLSDAGGQLRFVGVGSTAVASTAEPPREDTAAADVMAADATAEVAMAADAMAVDAAATKESEDDDMQSVASEMDDEQDSESEDEEGDFISFDEFGARIGGGCGGEAPPPAAIGAGARLCAKGITPWPLSRFSRRCTPK